MTLKSNAEEDGVPEEECGHDLCIMTLPRVYVSYYLMRTVLSTNFMQARSSAERFDRRPLVLN